ncbi:MAG: HAMP domain-containing histidine kinase, partial [Campylobacteraceae bacterium]|nr:HAMP domain-containing histidine kinase [Campylobacteraceae bacterium]
HEINTPIGMSLTGITHFIDITDELNTAYKEDEMSQEDFEKYLKSSLELSKSINTNLVKAANLIRSFKEVSVDQSSEAQRTFNMKEYLEEVLLSLHHEIKRKKHTITIDCVDDLVITSYPGSFSQIITNLIMNSFIHAFKGESVGNILIEVLRDKDILFLTYTDDGRGIAQANLGKIFEPFFTTNRKDGGSGLGLNIIFNIVNTTLRGKVECSSLEGIGVEFKIIIPLENEEK